MKGIKRFLNEIFWQKEEELCIASWARWDAQRNGLVGKKVSGHKSGNTNAEQKDKKYSKMRS